MRIRSHCSGLACAQTPLTRIGVMGMRAQAQGLLNETGECGHGFAFSLQAVDHRALVGLA